MPEQTSFNFDTPSEKPADSSATPAAEKEIIAPAEAEVDLLTAPLPLIDEQTARGSSEPASDDMLPDEPLPPTTRLTEEDRSRLIQSFQEPLSGSLKKFRESNITGRLKILDNTLPEGEITYTEMYRALELTEAEEAILLTFEIPKVFARAIKRRYDLLLRRRNEPVRPPSLEAPITFTRNAPTQFQSPPQRGPRGGGRGAAIPDDN